ncbi:MAG: LapA family protein [Zoogloeaceae bacterium]|jgi:uncharacterized integral membrane protein|nr:LapA family protein [Zoogloeaceae bacterium]
MRALTLSLRVLLFVFFFVFALKNTAEVPFWFFFGQVRQTPLSLLLLGFFAAGVFLALVTFIGARLRMRSEIARLRRENARLALLIAPEVHAPIPDAPVNADPAPARSSRKGFSFFRGLRGWS